MRRNSYLILSLSFICLIITNLQADPVSINPRPRFESMGHAGLAMEGSPASAVMNPAGLADIKESTWDIFPLIMEFPFDVETMSKGIDYWEVASDKDASQADKKKAAETFFSQVAAETLGARINLYPSYTRKYFHLGLLLDAVLDSKFQLGGFAANQVAEAGDTSITAGVLLGGAYSFLDESLQVGLTLKPLFRNSPLKERVQRVNVLLEGFNEDVSVKNQIFGKGAHTRVAFGFGVDLGLKYWIPEFATWVKQLRPAVGVTYQDIGNTRFFSDDELPEDIPQSISAGLAIHPEWGFARGAFALDFRNINEKQDFLNMLHFGSEVVFWDFWALRFGVAQGYLTGGMGLDIPFFELDLYVTAEETGRFAHIDDRRTVGIRISISI